MTFRVGQNVQRKQSKQVVEIVRFNSITKNPIIRVFQHGITMEGAKYQDIEVSGETLLPVYYKITYSKNIEQGGKIFNTADDARKYAKSRIKFESLSLEDLENCGFIFYEKVILY